MSNSAEKEVREFLNTLSWVDRVDSTYLFQVDFNITPLDSIFYYINALYNEVETLKGMVDRNFKQREGEHVLIPSSRETQSYVIANYSRKQAILNKILSNQNVSNLFWDYRARIENDNKVY